MNKSNYVGGLIWTNHALQRLGQRGLSQEKAIDTFNNPDRTLDGKHKDTKEFQKKYGSSTVTLITKRNESKEWVVLSCWIDPPLPGSEDDKKRKRYQNFRKASFWGKIYLTLRDQLGF